MLVKTTQKQLDEASQYKIGETTLWRDKKWSDRTHQLQICEVVGVHDDYIHEIQKIGRAHV